MNSINLLSYYYFGLLRFLLVTYLPLVFDIARNPDEAGSANSTSLQPFDLNHFFGEDGKIYGYKNLKVNKTSVLCYLQCEFLYDFPP